MTDQNSDIQPTVDLSKLDCASTACCRVCGNAAQFIFHANLLRYRIAYYECCQCRFVQTQAPFWLDEAYADTINISDTGILRRNQRNQSLVIRAMSMLGCLNGNVVDCAGGYGLLVRLLRDAGVHAHWHDPYCKNLVARGFEADPSWKADLVTGFEVLEHLEHPLEFFQSFVDRSRFALLSTQLMPTPTPAADRWWYYGREHGQHIGFYRRETLAYIANRIGWHVCTDGKGFHLFSQAPVASWRWWLARRTQGLSSLIAKTRLRSLMWVDHRTMSQPKAA